ncbi:DUF2059 domain-containing protein [Chryseobacterium sp.]|uniref:DUF2059 domain-containing protein n=1 Tax=Chryseobacterium sp. TaxID=1871047 RepID=UPI0025C3170F|nr:DUF2059 domain-containing protein [Chryseobacterium sp.]
MKRKKVITVFVLFLGILSFAQSKKEKIKEVMGLMEVDKLTMQTAEQMIGYYKNNFSDIPEDVWNDFLKEIHPEKMIESYVLIYDKYYTESDLDELITFYKSPVGQKTIKNMPAILKESMEAGAQFGREIGERLLQKMKDGKYQSPPPPMPSDED